MVLFFRQATIAPGVGELSYCPTTLNIVFSVTLYLELLNTMNVYYASHFLPTEVKLVV